MCIRAALIDHLLALTHFPAHTPLDRYKWKMKDKKVPSIHNKHLASTTTAPAAAARKPHPAPAPAVAAGKVTSLAQHHPLSAPS